MNKNWNLAVGIFCILFGLIAGYHNIMHDRIFWVIVDAALIVLGFMNIDIYLDIKAREERENW